MATASSFPSDLAVPYWDVAPSLVREPYRETPESVRLSVLGDPGGEVSFVSTNPDVARVKGGVLHFGGTPGAAVITAEAVREGAVRSRRYIRAGLATLRVRGAASGRHLAFLLLFRLVRRGRQQHPGHR